VKGKRSDREPGVEERPFWRNSLYEDLYALPEGAGSFVRRWVTWPQRDSLRAAPESGHTPLWGITELFLEEVLGVDGPRIQAIRNLGDALADEVVRQNDRQLFRRALFRTAGYPAVRRELLRVSKNRVARGDSPLLTFDDFLAVFEESPEVERRDWRLAWDLAQIRLIDQLHERGWVKEHQDTVQAAVATDGAETSVSDDEDDTLPGGVEEGQ
jgi:hypothetical protein